MSVLNTLLSGLDATSVFIFLVVFFIGYYWLTTPKNLPPGPPALPVVGNFISVLRARNDFYGLLTKWHKQYGDIFRVKMGSKYLIIISSYKEMHDAFVKQADRFSSRPIHLHSIEKVTEATGSGVMFGTGSTWKALRRLTLMTLRDFGVGKKSLEQRVQEEARAVVEVLEKGQGQPVTPKMTFAKFSSNIICSVVLGNRFDYDDSTFKQLTEKISSASALQALFSPVNFFPLARFIPALEEVVNNMVGSLKDVSNFMDAILKDHEVTYDPGEVRDFVDLYIKTRDETKDSQLYDATHMRRVIVDLLLAGTETTSTTVDWIILYLITFPEVQRRCQQEVDQVIGQSRQVTAENRKDLPYVMAVISETMRICPVAPLILPHFTETGGEVGGYTVPADSIVVANVGAIHHEPAFWPEPHVFKPERFLDEDGKFCQPKDNLVPFSNGPRVCLGESLARLEMFILLVTLLQSFTFTMDQGQKPDLEGHLGVTYSAKVQPVLANPRSMSAASNSQ